MLQLSVLWYKLIKYKIIKSSQLLNVILIATVVSAVNNVKNVKLLIYKVSFLNTIFRFKRDYCQNHFHENPIFVS